MTPAHQTHNTTNLDAVPEWITRAACRGTPTHIWFPPRGESAAQAHAICATCPVIDECRTYALDNRERFGIWGDTSERQRRRLQRTHRVTCPECGTSFTRTNGAHTYCGPDCAETVHARRNH